MDEYPLFRKGITDVLASHPDFQVIGATADDKTALSLLSLKPDLLVLDLDAQGFSPTDLLSEVKYRLPSCRTLMLLNKAESSQVLMPVSYTQQIDHETITNSVCGVFAV